MNEEQKTELINACLGVLDLQNADMIIPRFENRETYKEKFKSLKEIIGKLRMAEIQEKKS